MAAILASSSCYCRIGDLSKHGKLGDDLSFSGSVSNSNHSKLYEDAYNLVKTKKFYRFQVGMQQTELPSKVGINGRAIKMRKSPSTSTSEIVNGSAKNVNGVGVVNGQSLVKRNSVPPLSKASRANELPPIDGLKVLPSDEGFSWANENYNSIQRSIDVWSFVLSLRVRILLDNAKWTYIGGFSEDKQVDLGERRRKTASWLRECVLQLGPTFIKLGQLSSTRSDLFPKEFVDELAKLQDRVPAFSPSKARSFIEKELGAPIHMLYKEFEDLPIAAASLGQLIAEYFQRSETLGGPTRDWIGIYEECAKILYEEIDYVNEGKNADRFRRDFRNIKWVRVPILKTGFFHADPHPGNLAIDVDEALIYYDFGMMGDIKSFTRERLLDLFYAVYEKDAKKLMHKLSMQVMQGLIDLGALQPTGDMTAVRRSVQFFLDNLLNQRPDQQQTLSAIGEELLDLRQQQPTGTQLVQTLRKQADDARSSTISMPYRVQQIEDIVKQLESGDLKLRVRVLESERAARKATILQMATIYTVFGGTLLNLGMTFSNQGSEVIANGSFVAAAPPNPVRVPNPAKALSTA
ncbi:hypothetical protein DH2020_049935 [Rehmannia glutinosa]|uniref:ABC1 atypical kinase-like domain-containing protein n=1 Tax=Rehmannia glutinosa TaxID=99300 RepID=A0ABR0U1D9_REHGL